MNRDKCLTCLNAAGLAIAISLGGMACILTGMDMDVTESGLMAIVLFCAVFSVVAALSFSFRRGSLILLGLTALLAGYLWRTGALELSVEALLYRISYIYDRAYRTGVIKWRTADPMVSSPVLGLCALAAVSIFLTVRTVCRSKRSLLAVTAGFLPLGVCLVATDTVPAAWCLFLLLAGLVLLILTNTVRRMNGADGNRLTALLLVPVMLFMLLMFWAVPRTGYVARPDDLQQDIIAWFQELNINELFSWNISGNGSGFRAGSVNLKTLGPKTLRNYAVMDVTGAQNGMLYLRGQSLDTYSGKVWSASEISTGKDSGWPTSGMEKIGTVKISTRSGQNVKFFPYYPGSGDSPAELVLKEGRLDNPFLQKEYSFTQMQPPADAQGEYLLSAQVREQCLQLPQSTLVAARKLLSNRIGDVTGMKDEKIAQLIGDYVRNCARYDLDTQAMPSYENDFAIWFLNSGETGYCVHFATAATVLLRAAGIPARYASGYAVNAAAGEEVTVTANLAHAWVEYFDPGVGWRVLDPTPAGWYETPEDPTTQPPETTKPSETTLPPSASTQPPTRPDSRPSEPSTEPTLPAEDSQGGEQTAPKADIRWLWTVLQWCGILLTVLAVLAVQYLLRLRVRNKRMHTGPVNLRALARWRSVLTVSRILKKQPPERLLELAEKARFSQHELTVPERMEFDRYLDEADRELSQKPWLKQWLIRLFWAI